MKGDTFMKIFIMCEKGYTRWLQEEISKFYRECNNDDYFQEESYNRYDNKRKFQR